MTWQSMSTLAGATAGTLVVANTVQRVFNVNPRWLALAIAQIIAVATTAAADARGSDYFIAVVNGCVIYCAAAGATQVAATPAPAAIPRGSDKVPSVAVRRRFFTPWFSGYMGS
jgi:hypothetical protein